MHSHWSWTYIQFMNKKTISGTNYKNKENSLLPTIRGTDKKIPTFCLIPNIMTKQGKYHFLRFIKRSNVWNWNKNCQSKKRSIEEKLLIWYKIYVALNLYLGTNPFLCVLPSSACTLLCVAARLKEESAFPHRSSFRITICNSFNNFMEVQVLVTHYSIWCCFNIQRFSSQR